MTGFGNSDNRLEESPDKKISLRISIEGKVQKVGYRAWLCKQARALGVHGWVRNRQDNNTVEAAMAGEEGKVRQLIQMAHIGPPSAVVKRIKEFPHRESVPDLFQILPLI
jgi:acylphosphatase